MDAKKIQNEAFNRRRREIRRSLPHYGPTLRALRRRIGQTQAECATMLGVSICSVSRWEVKANPLPLNTWKRILKTYGVGQETAVALCPPDTPAAGPMLKPPAPKEEYAAPKVVYSLSWIYEQEIECIGFDNYEGSAVTVRVNTPRDMVFTTPGWRITRRQKDILCAWLEANTRPDTPRERLVRGQNTGTDLI